MTEGTSQLVQEARSGSSIAVARILNALDRPHILFDTKARQMLSALLQQADRAGRIIGITGPPGVGKSTLTANLARGWMQRGLRVAILAVDPSSTRSGGALLGDRIRMRFEDRNQAPFIRSLATRSALGGISEETWAAGFALRGLFDLTIIETVGVGQNELAVSDLADLTMLVMQPGSGDMIQYIKAGIMEIPDLCVVHKSDLKELADRTAREMRLALRAQGLPTEVLKASSEEQTGLTALLDYVDTRRDQQAYDRLQAALARWQVSSIERYAAHTTLQKLGGSESLRARVQEHWATHHSLLDPASLPIG